MPPISNPSDRLRVAHLNPRSETPFDIAPDEDARAAMAEELDIIAVPQVQLTGAVAPHSGEAWALDAKLTARVVQPCVVTLEPVETAIEQTVRRVYSPHVTDPEDELAEMPDEEVEPLGQNIDLGAVLIEELALALPLYPRADGATYAPTGEGAGSSDAEPVAETRRPFAGLGKLMGRDDG
ncbi:DUF177 domain-containing protein [Paracoccus sp. TK19116]|uniref:DUF177 domain-containing protein n=1 Tax=Paracoccus albicereus TaxID=2922394 RepID=A0ABT1MPV2_9RHOB|nr:DUF177 domain-containing protein [Paracoccus albicereus]MCQ0970332.1 DUF177 domain-containing protein [Paracoccus albicereus]